MAPVLTKRDFVRRYAQGEFGNRAITWNTLGELFASDYSGLVHLRNRAIGGKTWYNISPAKALRLWSSASSLDDWYCSAMAPHEYNLLQGEVQQAWDGGLVLTYSRALALPMRDALQASCLTATGLMVVSLLRQYLNPVSYDWLQELLDLYPGHVVEFSAFSRKWGTLPQYNTVFWEVRSY